MKIGQQVQVRVDAIADRELNGRTRLDQPDRGSQLPSGMGLSEKTFPAPRQR